MTVNNSGAGGDRMANGLVASVPVAVLGRSGIPVANLVSGFRVTVPKAGTLHDLAIFPLVQNGNLMLGVYDTGDALAGSATLLFSSGSVACPAVNAWRVIGDPALAVTAGQQLDLAIVTDAAVARFAAAQSAYSDSIQQNTAILPTNFYPATGGLSPKLAWERAAGSFTLPTTMTEANRALATTNDPFCIIGRIA